MATLSEQTGINLILNPNCKFPQSRAIGIEVEAERLDGQLMALNGWWKVHEDGSLRNNGREFVSYPPITFEDAPEALDLLFKNLPEGVDFSKRTSTHVHVNCLDLTVQQITKIFLTYCIFERDIFNWIGVDRSDSIFCVPMLDTDLVPHVLMEKSLWHARGLFSKYTALNLKPISNYGTIEWRHFGGLADREKFDKWLGIIQAITTYAVNSTATLSAYIQNLSDLNTNSEYKMFYIQVLGDSYSEELFTGKSGPEEAVTLLKSFYFKDVKMKLDPNSPMNKFLGRDGTESPRRTKIPHTDLQFGSLFANAPSTVTINTVQTAQPSWFMQGDTSPDDVGFVGEGQP